MYKHSVTFAHCPTSSYNLLDLNFLVRSQLEMNVFRGSRMPALSRCLSMFSYSHPSVVSHMEVASTLEHISYDLDTLWHPYTSMTNPTPALPVERANGVHLHLESGESLVDGMVSGISAVWILPSNRILVLDQRLTLSLSSPSPSPPRALGGARCTGTTTRGSTRRLAISFLGCRT